MSPERSDPSSLFWRARRFLQKTHTKQVRPRTFRDVEHLQRDNVSKRCRAVYERASERGKKCWPVVYSGVLVGRCGLGRGDNIPDVGLSQIRLAFPAEPCKALQGPRLGARRSGVEGRCRQEPPRRSGRQAGGVGGTASPRAGKGPVSPPGERGWPAKVAPGKRPGRRGGF